MRIVIWVTLAVFVGVYVAIAFATVDRSSDQAQVNALIARGIAATQARDLTTMVSCISPNYKDDALKYDQLRMVLAQALRNESDYTVHASEITTEIERNEATVKLRIVLTHASGAKFYDRGLALRLAKEDDRHMLVAPCTTWRVVGSPSGLGLTGTSLY